MKSEFLLAFNEICESRSLSKDVVLEAIETALVSAFRRNVGVSNAQHIAAKVDPVTGLATILAEKEVVEVVQDDRTECNIKVARRLVDQSVELGDMVMVDSTPDDFGRIAAQTAKQVILQRIREAERDQLFEDFSGREGEIVNGTVQSVTPQAVTLGLGRTEALLPRNQQVPGERYYPHDKVRAYVLEVRRASRGPQIIVSRSHRNMLRRMLELEVPEIYNGLVEIKNVAREAGQRSKVAVHAMQQGVDPVGACVGMRGVRIQSIVRELNDEKIDVIEWNSDPRIFIAKALSPARVSQVFLHPDADSGKTATVIVADDQLSLAIGREGQNARLAAKLTGWRIDIKSLTEATSEALTKRDDPLVAAFVQEQSTLIEQAEIVLAKKAAERPITAEDFQVLNRVINIIEGRFQQQAEAKRQAEEEARKAIAPLFWQMPISLLSLSEEMESKLLGRGFESVGHILALFSFNTASLQHRAQLNDKEFNQLQEQLAATEFPKTEADLREKLGLEPLESSDEIEEQVQVQDGEQPTVVEEKEQQATDDQAEAIDESVEDKVEPVALYAEPPPEIRIPSAEPEPEPEPKPEPAPLPKPEPKKEPEPKKPAIAPARQVETEEFPPAKKKGKKKRRELVFDEHTGEVVTKRKRRRGRTSEWDDFLG